MSHVRGSHHDPKEPPDKSKMATYAHQINQNKMKLHVLLQEKCNLRSNCVKRVGTDKDIAMRCSDEDVSS